MNNLPKVSIVVTAYQPEAKKYLDLCVESVMNLNYPADKLELIIVGKKGYMPTYDTKDIACKTVAPPEEQFWTARGVNYGISQRSADSQFIFYMNDDAFFTRNSLLKMITTAEIHSNHNIVLNALSCCDNYLQYALTITLTINGELCALPDRFYKYDDLKEHFSSLMNSDSIYPSGLVYQNYLCIYATLIPTKVWELVGEFDENYKIGQDDLQWSIDARKKGVLLASDIGALIHHFGGSSNSATLTDEIRRENVRYFFKRNGSYPPGMSEKDT